MQLSFDRYGAGEPLLLVQGMSGHRNMWGKPFIENLARDFDVVAFDHRGIGGSDRAEAPFTIEDLAHDAVELMDRIGWESAHIVGISMGGMVSQEIGRHYPDRVRTLTLGCTTAGALTADKLGKGLGRMVAAMQEGREAAQRAAYEANLSAGFIADPANYEPFLETVSSLKAPGPVIQMQLSAGAQFDSSRWVGEIAAPVLVIHGTEDDMIPAVNGEHLAELIPGSRLELFAGTGHLFWWEEPEKSAALIREHALGRKGEPNPTPRALAG